MKVRMIKSKQGRRNVGVKALGANGRRKSPRPLLAQTSSLKSRLHLPLQDKSASSQWQVASFQKELQSDEIDHLVFISMRGVNAESFLFLFRD